jgi:hypothetical protein
MVDAEDTDRECRILDTNGATVLFSTLERIIASAAVHCHEGSSYPRLPLRLSHHSDKTFPCGIVEKVDFWY